MAIPFSGKRSYEFGPFHLDPSGPLLLRSGELVTLPPKTLEILAVLVDQRGTLVSKDNLLSAVWPDTFVEESNLTHHISLLRKALGDGQNGQPYIATIPKRGYRFAGPVREADLNGQPAPASDSSTEAVPPKRRRRWVIAAALTASLTVVALGVGWRLWHSTSQPS